MINTMQITLLSFITIIFYGIATIWQAVLSNKSYTKLAYGSWVLGVLAVILHAALLHRWIDVNAGQNLTPFNLVSLVDWLVAVLILIGMLNKPIGNLTLLIFPIAAVSIILALIFPQVEIMNTVATPKTLVHILLSTVAFSVLCIAALQAIMINLQEYALRTNRTNKFFQLLPPLEIMEKLLFQMLVLGFILFTLVVGTSIWFFPCCENGFLGSKLLISIIAWLVFAVIFCGHLFFGWRGKQLIRWTISGVTIVAITFFWSEIL